MLSRAINGGFVELFSFFKLMFIISIFSSLNV